MKKFKKDYSLPIFFRDLFVIHLHSSAMAFSHPGWGGRFKSWKLTRSKKEVFLRARVCAFSSFYFCNIPRAGIETFLFSNGLRERVPCATFFF